LENPGDRFILSLQHVDLLEQVDWEKGTEYVDRLVPSSVNSWTRWPLVMVVPYETIWGAPTVPLTVQFEQVSGSRRERDPVIEEEPEDDVVDLNDVLVQRRSKVKVGRVGCF
jgi:hypothetical protein